MKTYFEWQTPDGFRPKKSAESLKNTFRPALLEAIFSIFVLGIIVLLWFLLGIKPGSLFAALYFILAMLVVLLFVFPPISIFVWILFALRRPPRSGSKVKLTENKFIFGQGRRGFWRYGDIQSFKITRERFKNTTVSVLELESFDGGYLSLGITPDVSIDQLSTVLSEQIGVAREKMKKSFIVRGRYWQNLIGLLLICFGLLSFVALFSISFDDEIAEKRAKKFEAKLEKQIAELRSEGIGEEQLAAFEKVIRWSLLKGLALSRWIKNLVLISIGSGLFLLGCVMTLWGRNRLLNDKIAKLEVYWADMFGNEETKQESEVIQDD